MNNIAVNFLAYTISVPVLIGLICLFIPEKIRIVTKVLSFAAVLIIFAASIRVFMCQPLYWPPVPSPTFIVDNLSALAGMGVSFFALIVTYTRLAL